MTNKVMNEAIKRALLKAQNKPVSVPTMARWIMKEVEKG